MVIFSAMRLPLNSAVSAMWLPSSRYGVNAVLVLRTYAHASDSLMKVVGLCVPNHQKLRHRFRERSAPPYAVPSYEWERLIGFL